MSLCCAEPGRTCILMSRVRPELREGMVVVADEEATGGMEPPTALATPPAMRMTEREAVMEEPEVRAGREAHPAR